MNRLMRDGTSAMAALLVCFAAGPVSAQPAVDPVVAQARQIMERYAERGTWSSPLLSAQAADAGAQSADTVMARVLAGYTRALLDHGGWINPYVTTPGYDAGNPLLAMAPGDGATFIR